MPRNELFFDVPKRKLGNLQEEPRPGQEELDVEKLTEEEKIQLARRGRAEKSGVSKPKGIAGGLRGDVSQILEQAAGVLAEIPSVVTANPQQFKGMRFDPRTRGGQAEISSVAPSTSKQASVQASVKSGRMAGPFERGRGAGPSAGRRGDVPTGVMSDVSRAGLAQSKATPGQRRRGGKMVRNILLASAIPAAALAGFGLAIGAPAGLATHIGISKFLTGMPSAVLKMSGLQAVDNFLEQRKLDKKRGEDRTDTTGMDRMEQVASGFKQRGYGTLGEAAVSAAHGHLTDRGEDRGDRRSADRSGRGGYGETESDPTGGMGGV